MSNAILPAATETSTAIGLSLRIPQMRVPSFAALDGGTDGELAQMAEIAVHVMTGKADAETVRPVRR